MVAQRRVLEHLLATLGLEHDQGVTPDPLDPPVGQAPVGVGGNRLEVGLDQLEPSARRAAGQDEHVHR